MQTQRVATSDPSAEHAYAPGEVVLFPGAPEHLHRVINGLVRLHTVDGEGNGLTLRYVKPGGYFGEEALTGQPRRYFAEAVTATQVALIAPTEMDDASREELAIHLGEAMQAMYRSLTRLAGKRLKARIAAELLELRDSDLSSSGDDGQTFVHITHDDLAAAVGSVRETVTKVVGELSRLGAITAGYGKIALDDVSLLREVAGE